MSAVHPIETDPSQVQVQVQDRAEACDRLTETETESETETETKSDCRQTSNELTEVDMTKRAKLNKRWHRRLKILLCCLGYKKNKVSSIDYIVIIYYLFPFIYLKS